MLVKEGEEGEATGAGKVDASGRKVAWEVKSGGATSCAKRNGDG